MVFLNLQSTACFIRFIMIAFVIIQVAQHAVQMSWKLQALGTTWEGSQASHSSAETRHNAEPFAGGEQARNQPSVNTEGVKPDQEIFLLQFFFLL